MKTLNELGENFEATGNGFVDFLLLDDKGFPLLVLEAKVEDKNPLVGKEQARKYAKSLNCRFIILSNGNLHYFWDLQQGNPHLITHFPTPESLKGYHKFEPNPGRLAAEVVSKDYIVQTQLAGYGKMVGWLNADERIPFIAKNKLRFLCDYQKKALQALQDAMADFCLKWPPASAKPLPRRR